MESGEFTHNNMQPFYRGTPKQNMSDTANRSILDNMIGTGVDQISKREQAPLFAPSKQPTGNVFGMESATSFFQERIVAPMSRSNELPVEKVRVGPGVAQGYSSLPTGGFQQFDMDEIIRDRGNLSVDQMRTESNPKLTYEGMMNPAAAVVPVRGDIGQVRKYRPDTFSINDGTERCFTTTGENSRPTQRATQVLKFQSRQETSSEQIGPAAATDFSATYTTPSFRAPFAQQQEGFGFRHADGSAYGVADTDAPHNDHGKAGFDLPVTQRNVTSERGQTLNLTGPAAMTVYDPKDVARTTVRETTGANDRVGGAVGALKLTVYDPTDLARMTLREITAPNDRVGGAVGSSKHTVYDPMDVPRETIRETTGEWDHLGTAAGSTKQTVYDPNDVPRETIRETTGEWDHLGTAAGSTKQTAYDPNDVPRQTVRETTGEWDHLGSAVGSTKQTAYDPNDVPRQTVRETTGEWDHLGSAVGSTKQTAYDPTDVPRQTVRETTGEWDHLGSAVGALKQTVYDPKDVARTTVRESTGSNDYVGVAVSVGAKKLTVYDPTDLPRATIRNTLRNVDTAMNVTLAGMPSASTLAFPDGMRTTTKSSVSARSAYSGSAGPATVSSQQDHTSASAMRSNPTKEVLARGRRPEAGNGSLPIFNGEDNVHLTHRRPAGDSVNDRANAVERVISAPAGAESIGRQRPKQTLKLDISRDRNFSEIIDTMTESNPYALPIHKIATGSWEQVREGAGPAEAALASMHW